MLITLYIEREICKVCLVFKPFTQTYGLDYHETFSPIIKMTMIRLVIFLAFFQHWFLHQLDNNTPFLHDDLEEEYFMTYPHGIYLITPTLFTNSTNQSMASMATIICNEFYFIQSIQFFFFFSNVIHHACDRSSHKLDIFTCHSHT